MNDRYEPVRAALPAIMPAITRAEAERANRRLWNHFGPADWKAGKARYQASTGKTYRLGARRCWVSTKPTSGHHKGWGRLVHDMSHRLFRRIYPNRRPHDPLHAKYEADVAAYVVEQGWLTGKLKPAPKVKAKPSTSAKLANVEAAIKRWTTKEKRARTALKKLHAKQRRLIRAPVIHSAPHM
jgi:hypothetical protein